MFNKYSVYVHPDIFDAINYICDLFVTSIEVILELAMDNLWLYDEERRLNLVNDYFYNSLGQASNRKDWCKIVYSSRFNKKICKMIVKPWSKTQTIMAALYWFCNLSIYDIGRRVDNKNEV